MRPKAEWAIDSEAITADRNDCFSKIQLVRQKIIERKLLSLVKAGQNAIQPQMFSFSTEGRHFSLLVGSKI